MGADDLLDEYLELQNSIIRELHAIVDEYNDFLRECEKAFRSIRDNILNSGNTAAVCERMIAFLDEYLKRKISK
jgi:Mg2+ and Co2+ transporter CorA